MNWVVEHLLDDTGTLVRVGHMEPRASKAGAPTVVLVPGRGDSLELRATVGEAIVAGGARAIMAEHAGQGGSGHLGRHRDAVHISSFETHIGLFEHVVQTVQPPVVVLAHSMGSLIATHLLARGSRSIAGAVLISPMWGFVGEVPLSLVRVVARTVSLIGGKRTFAPGETPFSIATCALMRTADPDAARFLRSFAVDNRGLVRGGSTWGWLAAASQAMIAARALPLEQVECPVVTISCLRDTTVALEPHHTTTARFPAGRVVELDARHDALSGGPDIEAAVWREVDTVLTAIRM